MMADIPSELWRTGLAVIAGAFSIGISVIAWLLVDKDRQQEKQIDTLFTLHREDVKRLQELEENIFSSNYVARDELNRAVDKIERSIDHAFNQVGAKLDRYNDALLAHITKDQK